jgi:hypothetical protein
MNASQFWGLNLSRERERFVERSEEDAVDEYRWEEAT